MEKLNNTLGNAKCAEPSQKNLTPSDMLTLSESRRNAPVGGTMLEGLAKNFVREFLPA